MRKLVGGVTYLHENPHNLIMAPNHPARHLSCLSELSHTRGAQIYQLFCTPRVQFMVKIYCLRRIRRRHFEMYAYIVCMCLPNCHCFQIKNWSGVLSLNWTSIKICRRLMKCIVSCVARNIYRYTKPTKRQELVWLCFKYSVLSDSVDTIDGHLSSSSTI